MEAGKEAGFYCETCDCTLKDSLAWLDHINGTYHNRALGMSMEVERSTVDQVKKRLEAMKRRKKGIVEVDKSSNEHLLLTDGKHAEDSGEDGIRVGSPGHGDTADGGGADDGDDADHQCGANTGTNQGKDDDEVLAMQKLMGFGSFGGT
jgi:hypothetical protein